MKLFDIFKSQVQKVKSHFYGNFYSNSIKTLEFLPINLSLFYYKTLSPVSTGIDLIGDEFQTIRPLILETKTKTFEDESPLLDLLNSPNSDQTRNELFGSIARFYLITGNAFIVATGDINKEPLELISINPQYIMTIQKSSKDMFADYYVYNSNNINVRFDRLEQNGRFRYVDKDRGLELWHIRDFSCSLNTAELWGQSRLNSIYLEMEQYSSSNKHNLSILKQGVRSSGILTSEQQLTQDQQDNLRSQLNRDYAGDVNAGRIFLLEGAKFDFKELSKSLKDMDFKDLLKDKEKAIFTRLKIPLPLVSTDNQKFDNIFEAKLSLYDNTVTPLTGKIFKELSLFLMPRFKIDIKNNTLAFNRLEIEVLRERELINVERLQKTNIMTTNELRALIGLDSISGGDILYQPLNLVPIGTTESITSESAKDSEKTLKLLNVLKDIKYKNGNNVYSLDA